MYDPNNLEKDFILCVTLYVDSTLLQGCPDQYVHEWSGEALQSSGCFPLRFTNHC